MEFHVNERVVARCAAPHVVLCLGFHTYTLRPPFSRWEPLERFLDRPRAHGARLGGFEQGALMARPDALGRAMSAGAVKLELPLRARLAALAEAARPREACGVLLGRRGAGRLEVLDLEPCPNRAADPRCAFEIEAHDFAAAEARARARGLEVVGFWHSHPDGPATPSAADRARAWPGYAQVVVGVGEGRRAEFHVFVGRLTACRSAPASRSRE